jgi:hypothetical protein
MFGATSKADLSGAVQQEKKTFFNRDMPDSYTEGGLQIGENTEPNSARKSAALSYKQQLDRDRQNFVPSDTSLPDARKRSAYDFAKKQFLDEEHPLGRSSMKALGAPSNFKPPAADKAQQAAVKRSELRSDRFDIITSLQKASDPENTPGARMRQQLLIGQSIPGSNDDGMLMIGGSDEQVKELKKSKQRAYYAQLAADQEASQSAPNSARGSAPNSARGNNTGRREYDSMYTDPSTRRIELTGNTGYSIGAGPSRDMSGSMKDIAFDAKRIAQAKYREQLLRQQSENAYHKSVKDAEDAQFEGSPDKPLPYMKK